MQSNQLGIIESHSAIFNIDIQKDEIEKISTKTWYGKYYIAYSATENKLYVQYQYFWTRLLNYIVHPLLRDSWKPELNHA